jgi:membrane-associated phospholipid phosphatase
MAPRLACVLVLSALAAGPARGEEPPAFVAHPGYEWAATVAGGALWFTTGTLIKKDIAPDECRWCEPGAFDDWASGLRWDDGRPADVTSDVISFALAPVAAGGLVTAAAIHDHRARELGVDLLIVGEAIVAAGLTGELLRFTTGRERPNVHELPPADKPLTPHPQENNLSFVSGHAATSVALALASGLVASRRRRRLAPVIWATGLTLAAVSCYLRVASGEHYATDVLGGIAVGAGVGMAVPLLHHPRREAGGASAALAPLPGGGGLLVITLR